MLIPLHYLSSFEAPQKKVDFKQIYAFVLMETDLTGTFLCLKAIQTESLAGSVLCQSDTIIDID